jgi:hypothetical protein
MIKKIRCEWQDRSSRFGLGEILRRDFYQAYNFQLSLPRNQYILLLTGSLGDLVPNFFLVEDFARLRNERVVVLTYQSMMSFATRLDSELVDLRFFKDEDSGQFHNMLYATGCFFTLEHGRIFPLLLTLHPYIAEATITGRMMDYEAKRLLLGLEYGHPLSFRYDEKVTKQSQENFSFVKKFRHSIVISPVAHTNQGLSPVFVKALVKELKDVCIILNLAGANQKLESDFFAFTSGANNVRYCNLGAGEVFEVVKFIGAHIGPLNGLTGLLILFDDTSKHVVLREECLTNPSLDAPYELERISDLVKDDWNSSATVLEVVLKQGNLSSDIDANAVAKCIVRFLESSAISCYEVERYINR